MRKEGFSYSEILKKVPVAKSTLSLWLRDVGLSKRQNQKLTEKKLLASKRGGEQRRKQRIELTKKIKEEAIKDIGKISKREFWLMGVMLYWAEGAKEKEKKPGSGVDFGNSDPKMIKFYLKWLNEVCGVNNDRISVGLYIHENSKNRLDKVVSYWINETGLPKGAFNYIYLKKHNPKTRRTNVGDNYYGLLRIKVSKSSSLTRKIAGWTEGINAIFLGKSNLVRYNAK